jgi:hypothetical protein
MRLGHRHRLSGPGDMTNRDNFNGLVKVALALRAGYRCAMCGCATVGPSDEAPDASASVGVAAHICAAAPGGRRYDAKMTPAERSHINNGIWLCATDSVLIDRDEVTYTAEVLHRSKRKHEVEAKAEIGKPATASSVESALVALGPDLVFLGEVDTVAGGAWAFSIEHFVSGDVAALTRLIGTYGQMPVNQRFVLSNALGDGRTLAGAPSLRRDGSRLVLACVTEPRFPRIAAQKLGADLALSESHDLFIENGNLAMVRGLDALPQKIVTSLSFQKGESLFAPDAGSRFGEFYGLFQGSPWLGEILKIETIRLAAIPIADRLAGAYAPFQVVEVVHGVEVLGEAANGRLPVRVDFEVNGVGRWVKELMIFVPDAATP